MTHWQDDVSNITVVTAPSLHLPQSRPTISVVGCGSADGKEWREKAKDLLVNAWQDEAFTIYYQDTDLTDENLAWVDIHAGESDYNLVHLGFPGSVNMLAIAARVAALPTVWISMDPRHPESTRTLLNSWAVNPILSEPHEQLLAMIAHRQFTKYPR